MLTWATRQLSDRLNDDASLTEDWYVSGVHPTLVWAAVAFVPMFIYWWPFVVVPNLIYAALPSLSCALYLMPSKPKVSRLSAGALAACDAVEARLGPADPQQRSAGKAYPAFACQGIGHKSSRYFGHAYYLLSHDLIGPRTQLYGYSFAAVVMTMVALAASEPSRGKRLVAFRRGVEAWVSFQRLFLLNYLLGGCSIWRIFDKVRRPAPLPHTRPSSCAS